MGVERRRAGGGELVDQSSVFLALARRVGGGVFLFADEAIHRLHPLFLGIALALAPVGAWLAVRGTEVTWLEGLQMGLLALAVVFWLIGFDISNT